jgi:hypothetical protein
MTATVVDTSLLLRLVVTASIAGIGVTTVFAVAIYGLVRSSELRRAERPVAATALAGLGITAIAATLAAVVYAYLIIKHK